MSGMSGFPINSIIQEIKTALPIQEPSTPLNPRLLPGIIKQLEEAKGALPPKRPTLKENAFANFPRILTVKSKSHAHSQSFNSAFQTLDLYVQKDDPFPRLNKVIFELFNRVDFTNLAIRTSLEKLTSAWLSLLQGNPYLPPAIYSTDTASSMASCSGAGSALGFYSSEPNAFSYYFYSQWLGQNYFANYEVISRLASTLMGCSVFPSTQKIISDLIQSQNWEALTPIVLNSPKAFDIEHIKAMLNDDEDNYDRKYSDITDPDPALLEDKIENQKALRNALISQINYQGYNWEGQGLTEIGEAILVDLNIINPLHQFLTRPNNSKFLASLCQNPNGFLEKFKEWLFHDKTLKLRRDINAADTLIQQIDAVLVNIQDINKLGNERVVFLLSIFRTLSAVTRESGIELVIPRILALADKMGTLVAAASSEAPKEASKEDQEEELSDFLSFTKMAFKSVKEILMLTVSAAPAFLPAFLPAPVHDARYDSVTEASSSTMTARSSRTASAFRGSGAPVNYQLEDHDL